MDLKVIFNGISSFGYILNKSQISSLIPEGRKFTIIARFNKINEQQYGYKDCYICVYPENATRCSLTGDSVNGWSIRCYNSENEQINFDLYTANTYNTSTTLDEWLLTLIADSFTQSSVSNMGIQRQSLFDNYIYNNMYFSTSKKIYNQDDTLELNFNIKAYDKYIIQRYS